MNKELASLHTQQKDFFEKKKTQTIRERKAALRKLKSVLRKRTSEIESALALDLGKSASESYLTEIGMVLSEIDYFLRNLSHLAKPASVSPSWINFPSKDYIVPEPYGLTLHIAPWNYPFQLSLTPLVGAIAAGNTVMLKPSEQAPHTAQCVKEILNEVFPEEWVAVAIGGPEVAQNLLDLRWDHIIYTGGTAVAKIVAQAAAKHLTPTTLELGGKNPCVVDHTADISVSARRIAFGKFLNCGQTCIAPDYIMVHKKNKATLIAALIKAIEQSYGNQPQTSVDYGKIINQRHFERLAELLKNQPILFGGETDEKTHYIAPTLVEVNDLTNPLMQEEIFGPILPIIEYESEEKLATVISRFEKPLSFYVFTKRKRWAKKMMHHYSYGGGVVNDTLIQFTNRRLPFGGVGHSGMGSYHGKHSFDVFSHKKPYIHRSTWLDPKMRYAPYGKNIHLLKKLLKWLS
ncbi:MAG: aldehyde dehydrogenase [Flavobacteriaceae bacterium]